MGEKNKEEIDKELERQDAERKRMDAEQKAALEEQRRLAKETAERAAKAEGMLEAFKTMQAQGQNREQQWTDAQWDEFKEKTGIGKEALVAIDGAVGAKITEMSNKFEERARVAEERARKTEEKYAEFEKTNTYSKIKSEYFSKKPQFARYEKEIDEFLSDYPSETRHDSEKMSKLLEKAEVFIRGKVGEKAMGRNPGGSNRFGDSQDEGRDDGPMETDFSDLRAHERMAMEKIVPSKENLDLLKKYKHDLKGDMGVMISSKEEFDNPRKHK